MLPLHTTLRRNMHAHDNTDAVLQAWNFQMADIYLCLQCDWLSSNKITVKDDKQCLATES